MTKSQKETLQKMRLAGKSYADICRVLGVKESTVRTFKSGSWMITPSRLSGLTVQNPSTIG